MISGYRLMWMMVMFDLPVVEPEDRRAAGKFRKFLDKEGFLMCQFSVYAKYCGVRERTTSIRKKIERNIPDKGKVSIIYFTDKQFGDIIHLYNRERKQSKSSPEQLILFADD